MDGEKNLSQNNFISQNIVYGGIIADRQNNRSLGVQIAAGGEVKVHYTFGLLMFHECLQYIHSISMHSLRLNYHELNDDWC